MVYLSAAGAPNRLEAASTKTALSMKQLLLDIETEATPNSASRRRTFGVSLASTILIVYLVQA
jgi:hypothetical protein